MEGKLLPCPNCQRDDCWEHGYDWRPTNTYVHYLKCKACAYCTGEHGTYETAIAFWNRRTQGWTAISECPEEWKDGRLCVLMCVNSSTVLARCKYSEFYEEKVWEDTTGRRLFEFDFIMPLPHPRRCSDGRA